MTLELRSDARVWYLSRATRKTMQPKHVFMLCVYYTPFYFYGVINNNTFKLYIITSLYHAIISIIYRQYDLLAMI